jgi:hypothetical protein
MKSGPAFILAVITSHVGFSSSAPAGGIAWQNPDQQVARSLSDGSREVVRTAPAQADRFETDHVIVYIDHGLLPADGEQRFARDIERVFVATSRLLRRSFNRTSRRTAKATYYLTNRAGISHAEATRIFLYASRVIPSPAISIHETVHLLLMKHPDAPRNRSDLKPEEDERLTAVSGVWLAEGFAGYVAYALAPTLGMEPDRLFVKGDQGTVDDEARQWMRDPRGMAVLPFAGAHGIPDNFLADRPNVAAPFYVLGHSFVKYLVQHTSLAVMARLYEEHYDGTRPIEQDVRRITGRDLLQWRTEWLQALGSNIG